MKILVTGGRGFIGWNIVQDLRSTGHDVWSLDSSKVNEYARLKQFDAEKDIAKYPEGNILFREVLEAFFSDHRESGLPFEAVIHMAAIPGVRTALEAIPDQIGTNGTGFANLLLAMGRHAQHSLKYFIYASSSSAYDEASESRRSKETINGRTVYGLSKAMNVAMVNTYARSWLPKTNCIGLRIHNAIGPFCRNALAPVKWTHDILLGRQIQLFSRVAFPNTPQDFLHRDFTPISDIIQAIRTILFSKRGPDIEIGERNLGHGDPVSILTMLNIMEGVIGIKAKMKIVTAPNTEALSTSSPNHFSISGDAAFAIQYAKLHNWMRDNGYLEKDSMDRPLIP